jgi:hypothetical protein
VKGFFLGVASVTLIGASLPIEIQCKPVFVKPVNCTTTYNPAPLECRRG